MMKERADHQPVLQFTKEKMEADKPVPVVNLPPVGFIGAPPRQGITGSIQGYWDPEILIAVIAI